MTLRLMSRLNLAMAALMAFAPPALSAEDVKAIKIEGKIVAVPGGAYVNIDALALAQMLKAKDFFLANVHIPYAGEIAGTDAFIPYDRTVARLSDYPKDKKAKIVLYCRSGRMSDLAAGDLVKAGFTNVLNLDGGMEAWQAAGFPLIQSKR